MKIGLADGAELYAQTMPLARQLDITYLRGRRDKRFPRSSENLRT